jgi:hypothetical protein
MLWSARGFLSAALSLCALLCLADPDHVHAEARGAGQGPGREIAFSGVYNPQCAHGLEVFSGAWLMSATRFVRPETLAAIKRIHFIEVEWR